jgi:hypothetical protein
MRSRVTRRHHRVRRAILLFLRAVNIKFDVSGFAFPHNRAARLLTLTSH